MLPIKELGHRLRLAAARSRRYSERRFKLFGMIAVFLIPLSTIVEQSVAPPSNETFYFRLLAAVLGLFLLFHELLPAFLKQHFDIVWVVVAAAILSYCFGAILAFNAAHTAAGQSPSEIWVYQYLVALFILIQLIHHGPLSAVLWLSSTLLVALSCLTIESPNYQALKEAWLYPLPVYLTALIIGSVTNRNVHMVQSEQLRAASAIGSNIAHELRTPLASIRVLAGGIGKFLPTLVRVYDDAKTAGVAVEEISPSQLRELRDGLASIQNEVAYSNTVIDMLLLNTTERSVSRNEFQNFRMSDAIQEAIARFPFNNSQERSMLKPTVKQDFEVHAPRLLVVHVYFNLIKNGIYHVQRGGTHAPTLDIHVGASSNVVEITDRGPGIARILQARIFDRFYSTTSTGQGAGIGLSFCKMVMEAIGGQIECESREGEYTTFRLTFPPVSR